MTRALFCSLILAASAVPVVAKPDFSGTWKMNRDKSDFGPMPGPDKMLRQIEHAEPNLKIVTTQSGQRGEIKSELKYTTDGKESVNETRMGQVKGTARWDGDTLVVKYKLNTPQGEIEAEDRWVLSSDGKVTTVTSVFRGDFGEARRVVVFDKE